MDQSTANTSNNAMQLKVLASIQACKTRTILTTEEAIKIFRIHLSRKKNPTFLLSKQCGRDCQRSQGGGRLRSQREDHPRHLERPHPDPRAHAPRPRPRLQSSTPFKRPGLPTNIDAHVLLCLSWKPENMIRDWLLLDTSSTAPHVG